MPKKYKNKLTVEIKGMHCRSCEMLVEGNLREIPEIEKANVNHKTGLAEIYYGSQKPNYEEIEEAIRKAGYSIGQNQKKSFISKNMSDYKDLGVAFLFLVGAYFVLKSLGLLNISFNTTSDTLSLPLVLLIGLTAGVSTCMALIGGLVLGISARHAEKHPEATAKEKFRPHLFFNLGRITSYFILGGLLGILGGFIQLSGLTLGLITIAVGLVMLLLGMQLIEIFPRLNNFKLTLPKGIANILGMKNHQKEYSHKSSFILGAMTFFLPCGFTQAMQLVAISTGSFIWGGLVMMTFAIGTLPGLLGVGGLTSVIKGVFAKRFFKFAGLVVIFFSIFNISNGFGLAGLNFAFGRGGSAVSNDPNVVMENGVQVVRMTENNSGYSPNKFTIKNNVPVKWIIDAQAPFSCASSIMVPKFNIRKNLVKGENIIEFTPTQTGNINFSCSMGMYTGVFYVVNENDQSAIKAALAAGASNQAGAAGGSCGGSAVSGSTGGGCGSSGAIGGGCGASLNGSASGGCGGSGGCSCGAGKQVEKDAAETIAQVQGDTQVINSTYTAADYLQPNSFKVKVGAKVKLAIDVKDDGRGCGYAIMIPGLYNNAVPLQAGQPITMEFTPTSPGSFDITCGMRMINYGTVVVE